MANTGKGKKLVKDYHKGTIAKNPHDTASAKVHQKHGTMGNAPKKTAHTKVKNG